MNLLFYLFLSFINFNMDSQEKNYFFEIKKFDDKSVLSPEFQNQVIKNFKAIRPFFDYMTNVLTTDLNGVSLL